jgi:hypothetical protein
MSGEFFKNRVPRKVFQAPERGRNRAGENGIMRSLGFVLVSKHYGDEIKEDEVGEM